MWLLVNVVVFLWLGWWAIGLHRLREGTRAITSGDLDHKIDTKYMPLDLRVHAEDLNNIDSTPVDALLASTRSYVSFFSRRDFRSSTSIYSTALGSVCSVVFSRLT